MTIHVNIFRHFASSRRHPSTEGGKFFSRPLRCRSRVDAGDFGPPCGRANNAITRNRASASERSVSVHAHTRERKRAVLSRFSSSGHLETFQARGTIALRAFAAHVSHVHAYNTELGSTRANTRGTFFARTGFARRRRRRGFSHGSIQTRRWNDERMTEVAFNARASGRDEETKSRRASRRNWCNDEEERRQQTEKQDGGQNRKAEEGGKKRKYPYNAHRDARRHASTRGRTPRISPRSIENFGWHPERVSLLCEENERVRCGA